MESVVEVEELCQTVRDKRIELVERKGLGHPDSLCDGIAESISTELSKEYIDIFGSILHHNTDEVQLIAGRANPKFGGGEVTNPIKIILAGRATREIEEKKIDIDKIAEEAALLYLDNTLDSLDVNKQVLIESHIGQGSTELKQVAESEIPRANDTSFGVGYAPLSETEKTVLSVEENLQDITINALGEDIKVMGKRHKESLHLTVAAATVSKYIENIDEYISLIDEIKEETYSIAEKETNLDLQVKINAADNIKEESIYLTETGTSAEMGDDGSVGRGNRVNGIITPSREMSLEAASGKNPASHVGKIYNLLSHQIAQNIVQELKQVEDAVVKILSEIGKPIDKPQVASIEIKTKDGLNSNIRQNIDSIVNENLEQIRDITERTINGDIRTF